MASNFKKDYEMAFTRNEIQRKTKDDMKRIAAIEQDCGVEQN